MVVLGDGGLIICLCSSIWCSCCMVLLHVCQGLYLKATLLWWWFPTDNYFSSLRAVLKCIICVSQWYLCCGNSYHSCICILSVLLYLYCLSVLLFLYKGTMSSKCQWVWHQEEVEGGTLWHMISHVMSVCLQHQCYPSTSGCVSYCLSQQSIQSLGSTTWESPFNTDL